MAGNTREITYYDVSPYAASSAVAVASGGEIQDFSDIQKKLFAENIDYSQFRRANIITPY